MRHVILRPGPELVLRAFRPEPDELGPRPKERNVRAVLKEVHPKERKRAGERIEWAVSLTPLRDLLALGRECRRAYAQSDAVQAVEQEDGPVPAARATAVGSQP